MNSLVSPLTSFHKFGFQTMALFDEFDDEQLLDLFDTTQQLLNSCIQRAGPNDAARIEKMSKKLMAIEEELKFRSLWESET